MYDEETELLARKISQNPPKDGETGEPIEAMLTKFVLITEWMDSEGSRYLIRRGGTGSGDTMTPWDFKGLLHEALYGQW